MNIWFYIQFFHLRPCFYTKIDRTPDPSSRAKRGDPFSSFEFRVSSFDSIVKGKDFAGHDGLPRFARSDEGEKVAVASYCSWSVCGIGPIRETRNNGERGPQ
jgi:hypothetical protein